MPNLEDVKAVLLKAENGQALYDVIADAVGSAKNERAREVEGLKNQLSTFLPVLKDLGYNPDSPDPEFSKRLKGELETGKAGKEKLSDTEKRLQSLEARLNETQAKYTQSETMRKNAIVKELLSKHLVGKIHGANARTENLILTGEVTLGADDKSLVWRGQDDFTRGLTSYLDANKDELVNSQGGGAGAGARGGNPSGAKQMSLKDFEGLSEDAKRDFLVKEKGELVK